MKKQATEPAIVLVLLLYVFELASCKALKKGEGRDAAKIGSAAAPVTAHIGANAQS